MVHIMQGTRRRGAVIWIGNDRNAGIQRPAVEEKIFKSVVQAVAGVDGRHARHMVVIGVHAVRRVDVILWW